MIKSTPMLMTYENAARILNGTKTETRRIMKPQPVDDTEGSGHWFWKKNIILDSHRAKEELAALCPFGKPGDQLWFKSPHYRLGRYRGRRFFPVKGAHAILKLSNDGVEKIPRSKRGWHLRPSIFMPKKLARLTATIVSVGVERVKLISRESALAEGLPFQKHCWREEWRDLWISINGKKSWGQNQWVWVIKFAKVKHHA